MGLCIRSCCANISIQRGRKSVASMNRYGEIGSLCLIPLRNVIFLPATEFKSICELPFNTPFIIQVIHYSGKPLASMTFFKKPQDNISKALYMSALNREICFFSRVVMVTISWAYMNSWFICLSLRNPVCAGVISSGIRGCNLFASNLEKYF
jgi:hypothetical protein